MFDFDIEVVAGGKPVRLEDLDSVLEEIAVELGLRKIQKRIGSIRCHSHGPPTVCAEHTGLLEWTYSITPCCDEFRSIVESVR